MELQPVIMAAGHGSRLRDLTSKIPKALLPVANQPLIWYPIQMLERAGFQEAIVVVLEHHKVDIQKAVMDTTLELEFVTIPSTEDWGTADSLRHIKHKIKADILLLSCDVITDLSLHLLADVHRTYDSTVTMLMTPLPDMTEVNVPGGKANKKLEKDFVGLDERGNRVLFLSSAADIEQSVSFRKTFLKKHPRIRMKTGLMDAHVYILKKWVVDYLASEEKISTVKGELIPYLVRKQFSHSKMEESNTRNQTFEAETEKDIYSYAEDDKFSQLAREMSSWVDHRGDLNNCFHGDKIRCYAYVTDGGYCIRANTLGLFCEANRQVPRQLSSMVPNKEISLIHPAAVVSQKTQVGADSMVGEGATIGERVGVKKSVIGKHCNIGDKVKIANSIIMDHVTIQEGSTLSGCVVAPQALISEKCELKDCLVGSSQNINAMGKFTNEVIVELDRMMEI